MMMDNWLGGMVSAVGVLIGLVTAFFYIIFLLAVWRFMRAHEQMAKTLREIADHLKPVSREP